MSNLWHRLQAAAGVALVYLATMQPTLTGKAGQLAAVILGIAALVGADPKKLKGGPPPTLLLLLTLPFLGGGCAFFQKPSTQRVIRCTGDVIAACKADLAPLVSCLNIANPTSCILAVGNAAGCAGKEALACKVREAAEPPVLMTFVSPTAEEQTAADRRRVSAKRFYADVGITPEAP